MHTLLRLDEQPLDNVPLLEQSRRLVHSCWRGGLLELLDTLVASNLAQEVGDRGLGEETTT